MKGAAVGGMAMRAAAFIVAACFAGAAAPGDGPERFVRDLYARYQADPHFFVTSLSDVRYEAVYSPSFMRLLNANGAVHAKRQDGGFDGDPLCDCQEHDWMTTPQIAVHRTGRAFAEATVKFTIEDTYVRLVTLKLVHSPAGWRVDDVGEAGWTVNDAGHPDVIPSLREWLINNMK